MRILASLSLLLFAAGLQAQDEAGLPPSPEDNVTEAFAAVDLDGNGLLSIEEARQALPDREIEDLNGDGWLNHAEVEQVVGELNFDYGGADVYTVVGESGYLEILRVVEGRELISQR